MEVIFILNRPGDKPIGGFKVVYEYANGLARRGHTITVVHAPPHSHGDFSIAGSAARLLKYSARALGIKKGYSPDGWFLLDPRVRILWVPSLLSKWIPKGDVVVATSWHTAEWVAEYPNVKGKKVYLVQDFEYYMTAETSIKLRMETTYKNLFTTIAISPAVKNMVEACGGKVESYIPNGLDFETFSVDNPIESESRKAIGFPFRQEIFKRTGDAIEALEIVREKVGHSPHIWSFGGKKPKYLPDWVAYYARPSNSTLRNLYNSSQIFVVPSLYEGWGLPGSEAMACGAALVSTDNGGVRAFAEHQKTALFCAPRDPACLAEKILQLLEDRELRLSIAMEGTRHIRQFTWERAVTAMENVCLNTANAH